MKIRDMLIARGYWNSADEEMSVGGVGGGTDTGGDTSVEASDNGNAEEKGDQQESDDEKNATSDADAKLLKEVMKKKAKNKELEKEIERLKSNLSKFEGINVDEVKKLLNEKKEAEQRKLEEKGEWDALKAQMKEANEALISERDSKINELQKKIDEQNDIIGKLTLGHAFDTSAFISEDLSLPPSKARIIYGEHFEIDGSNIVAYDKPRGAKDRTPLVDASGNMLSFDDALRKIVDSDPDKSAIIKVKQKPGAGSGTTGARGKAQKTNLTGISKIEAALSGKK